VTLDLPHARALCDAASAGPWEARRDGYIERGASTPDVARAFEQKDAEFIAAARTLLPQCLDRIEELEAVLVQHNLMVRELAEARAMLKMQPTKGHLLGAAALLEQERDTALASAAELRRAGLELLRRK
jgi:hypothetical protein